NLAPPRGRNAKNEILRFAQDDKGTDAGLKRGATGAQSTVAVLDADDARVIKFAEGFAGRVVTFGFGAGADFRAENFEDRGVEGSAFDLLISAESAVKTREMLRSAQHDGTKNAGLKPGATRTRLELALAGRHNVMNALAALAAANEWGVSAEEAKTIFATLRPAAMRGEVLKFESGFTVINDSYNSNPVALAAMVELLAATPGYRRRILAAGEMLELGAESARLHREAGALAASKGIEWIIGVQGMAEEIVRGAEEQERSFVPAKSAGTQDDGRTGRMKFFDTSEEAATFLCEFVEPGDLLLVKGSRGVKMERIVAALSAKFAQAAQPPRNGEILRFAQDDKERRH
ncbi:MAG: Mur ligase family protein, partial [Acidobacteria bacterium]|nr:Mur ligase family protein [Acidobacteriota bacterium]